MTQKENYHEGKIKTTMFVMKNKAKYLIKCYLNKYSDNLSIH